MRQMKKYLYQHQRPQDPENIYQHQRDLDNTSQPQRAQDPDNTSQHQRARGPGIPLSVSVHQDRRTPIGTDASGLRPRLIRIRAAPDEIPVDAACLLRRPGGA